MKGVPGLPKQRAALAGLAAALLFGAAVLAFPASTADVWRETAQDDLARLLPPDADDGVVVVDIDRASLTELGAWPWPRQRLASLLHMIARAEPQAVGVDILLAGADRGSPIGEAISITEHAGRTDLAQALATLDSSDRDLAATFREAPTALDFLLSDKPEVEPLPNAPVAVSGTAEPLEPWHAPGALLPLAVFRAEAKGLGTGSLQPGPGGLIRTVPLFVTAGEAIGAGLALETARVAAAAGSYIVDLSAGTVSVGPHLLPLGRNADLRFRATGPEHWQQRTISAAALLAGSTDPARMKGRIVILGGSAPELGALRATAESPVAPSVQIQADAVETILSGTALLRPSFGPALEVAAGLLLAAVCAAAFAFLPPVAAGLIVLAALAAWPLAVIALLRGAGLVLDPASPAIAGLFAAATTALVTYGQTRRSAALVRRRFERHLAPAVVERIVAQPGLVKLGGERREVTVLSTDIENFTAMVERIDPAMLVQLLDRYLGRVTAIAVEHGGLVDKIIGDSVHAIFNAPLDVPGHETRAIACAFEIMDFTEAFRHLPDIAGVGLGRTRIGIETGAVVVGEFGAGDRLDYTAYGSAVNTASRLEGLNKELGTSICVGPMCRSRVSAYAFRDLGPAKIRGRGALHVFEPLRGTG